MDIRKMSVAELLKLRDKLEKMTKLINELEKVAGKPKPAAKPVAKKTRKASKPAKKNQTGWIDDAGVVWSGRGRMPKGFNRGAAIRLS